MIWPTPLMVFLALGYYTDTAADYHMSFQRPEGGYDGEFSFGRNEGQVDHDLLLSNEIQDRELEQAMDILRKVLILPWPNGVGPLVYVENNRIPEQRSDTVSNEHEMVDANEELNTVPNKRMRYYRKYPWKRQNVEYDPDSRFICTPSKHEVHRLLVALHETRFGNKKVAVDFCNRKRPALSVFTNMRYMGK